MHSYSSTPSPKMSARPSTSPPSICSGAMCAGLPRTWPVEVTPCASRSFAIPEVGELHEHPLAGLGARRFTRRGSRAVLEHHVLRLDVAMDDASSVRMREGREQLDPEGGGDLGRNRTALGERLPKRRAADELDDEILLRLLFGRDVEDLDDVRVTELRDRLRLDVEALLGLERVAEVRMDDLGCNIPPETRIVRPVDGGHSPMADFLEHLVLREHRHAPAKGGSSRRCCHTSGV